ncbi:NagC family transcriptional regulator [Bifidobacterium sp. UTCIF-39]|uniref:ROK family transcriptional regulator n=1 Tax=Bifidobacterium sp. UTCIF-39 TaxID=1465359 RepID=UPI00112D52C7|nr:ROK family transcriptional regulator [Bifidobacterium sp. UTCIF-39]TPF97245.1 NagC family transcriptional regulator [Bifidobacterium sp. UTCIF-39]
MIAPPGSTHASMAELNRSRIIQLLHRDGICSRAHIARKLDLTPAAITKITAQLIDMGVVSETGNLDGIKKRRSIGLQLNESKYRVIAVKFARSLAQIGVFDLGGNLESMQTLPPVRNDTIRETCDDIKTRIRSILDKDDSIVAIGMAVPGPYLRDEGRTAVVTSMLGWRNVNFIEEFSAEFRVPVFIEQDARAGALAQALFNPEATSRNLGYYLIGEGVGLGLMDHGELLNGELGAATEIGHISIDAAGKPCECGNVGCLENYCSAVAFHGMVTESGLVPGSEYMNHAEACRAAFSLARNGDPEALALIRDVSTYIGYGCVTIINAFNPKQIIIGDIMAEAGEPMLERVRDIVAQRVIPVLDRTTEIMLSDLPVDATLNGAAAVATAQFLEHPSEFVEQTEGM